MAVAGAAAVPTRDPGRLTVEIRCVNPPDMTGVSALNPDVGGRVEVEILDGMPLGFGNPYSLAYNKPLLFNT